MEHFILVNSAGVYVKEGSFFRSQGGMKEEWGQAWERVEADSIEHARQIGIVRRRNRFPHSHRTLGETT